MSAKVAAAAAHLADQWLSDDELLDILCRQLHGRNDKYSSPAFKQRLAEDAFVTRLGDFKVGERIFTGFSNVELESECTCGASAPELCTELSNGVILAHECSCQDLDKLVIQGIHLSGSKREGNDVRLSGGDDWSDIDVMVRLGPIYIMGEIAPAQLQPSPNSTNQEQGAAESADFPEDTIVVRLEPTNQPGFVQLRHQPRPGCEHSDWLTLSADLIKCNIQIIGNLGKTKPLKRYRFGTLTSGGPALTSSDGQTDADIVPCVTLPRWPSAEFASRQRPLQHPPPQLVERLCRTPAMLVPVGFEGSPSQREEWRLSFSRHEHIMLQLLTDLQRDCLAVLKHCCALLLGPHGDVKGAYLKMCLLWECEEADPDTWQREGLRTMSLRVLCRLQEFARQGRLPCYFWSEINMLATRTKDELKRLDRAVQCLKAHFQTAVTALVALHVMYNDSGVCDPRLPARRWDALWSFVMDREQPVRPEDPLLTDTWLNRSNFSRLVGRTSSMSSVYDRVLASLIDSDTGIRDEDLEDDWLRED